MGTFWECGAIDLISFRWAVPSLFTFYLEYIGSQWLLICRLLPGLKYHIARKPAQIKPTCCLVFPLMALQQGLQGKAMQENRALIPAKTQACIRTRPQSDGWGQISGCFYNLTALIENDVKSPWGEKKKKMLLALKCLSSNKNMRNKHIKISPLKVVSCSSFSLPEASPRKLASQDQHKTILLKGPRQNIFQMSSQINFNR